MMNPISSSSSSSWMDDCIISPSLYGTDNNNNDGLLVTLSAFIWTLSICLFGTAIYCATIWQSQPLDDLGLRPHGTGLISWIISYYFTDRIGIYGYDTIQGALSPPLRIQCHISAWLALWGTTLLWWNSFFFCRLFFDNITITTSPTGPCQVYTVAGSAMTHLALYLSIMGVIHYVLPSVSMPGGPRPHKIQRQPQWKDDHISLDQSTIDKWRCLISDESHQATNHKFEITNGTDNDDEGGHDNVVIPSLTGESAGRQTWFNVGKASTSSSTDSAGSGGSGSGVGPVGFVLGLLTAPLLRGSSDNNNNNDRGGTKAAAATEEGVVIDEDLVQLMALGGRDRPGFNPSKNPNSNDQIFRAQQIRSYLQRDGRHKVPDVTTRPTTVREACHKAAHFYSMLQCDDGHWAADYGGPHFLMPGLVTAWYIMGKPTRLLDDDQIALLKHYILVHQQVDGGWGTHIESPSTMFGSTLMYVALRLLGVGPDHPSCVEGRKFLHTHGGALCTSSWSKFYLCLLGLMDWRGHNSVPPEMWLLPNWFPFHPGRMWCHARMVYLPMGYLYGHRFVYPDAEKDPLIQALRKEIYVVKDDGEYSNIPWTTTRHWVADTDNYSPIPWVMKTVQNILARYEEWSVFQPFKTYVRQLGLDFSLEYMNAEDLQTNYIDIGPVNKVLNMISTYHSTGGNIDDLKVVRHMMRVQDYLWVAEDGMKMQGYNGSQCWDTSFCAQALYEADMLDEFPDVTRKVWSYLERTQILSTKVSQSSPAYQYESNQYRLKFYRHISEGGWPFSTSAHGWPISDCTSEGLKAVLCLLKTKTMQKSLSGIVEDSDSIERGGSKAVSNSTDTTVLVPISNERLYKAVNVLLTYQNEDGGWATYENNRGWGWYEQLNPSEVFGDIMIDYSYVECSMAVLTALVDFAEMFPDHRPGDIQHSVRKGRIFLKSIQRPDGSWYGSWACCFCYGTWFGVEGLVKCGEPLDSPSITKACEFLLRQQRPNGGWGEDFTSCYDKDYAQEGMKAYGDDGSGVVNTAWALLALSMARWPDVDPIRRGVAYLMRRQLPSGDWPQEGIAGVFNRSVGITYTAYRNVFPIWAMGRCRHTYGDQLDESSE